MSNSVNNNIELHPIVSPTLNDAGYAENLEKVFANINSNFNVVSNHDFIKGETGDSIRIEQVNWDSEIGNNYIKQIKNCIKAKYPVGIDDIKVDNKKITIWDNINNKDNRGNLYMVYKKNEDIQNSQDLPISSFYYIFLDGRFNTDNVESIPQDEFIDKTNASCVLIFDGGEFKVLDNAFPSMYFDRTRGFCWEINGVKTGLTVQGLNSITNLVIPIDITTNVNQPAHCITAAASGVDNEDEFNDLDDMIIASVSDKSNINNKDNQTIHVVRTLKLLVNDTIKSYELKTIKTIPAGKQYFWNAEDGSIVSTLDVNPTNESTIYDENNNIISKFNFMGFSIRIDNPNKIKNTSLNIDYDVNIDGNIAGPNAAFDKLTAKTFNVLENTKFNNVEVSGDAKLNSVVSNSIIANKSLAINDRINVINKEFIFDTLGDLVVMNYDNKPFILLKSNIPDFDNPDDIMISGSMAFSSESKKYDVSLPILSRWGEQCISNRFNVNIQNYTLNLEDVLLGVVIPADNFKYEINISPDLNKEYNYRYVVFTLDFPYPINIDLSSLASNNTKFNYDFELNLVCNNTKRTIIKKSITNSLPRLMIEGFNSLTYMLDLKTNKFLLINGKESIGFTDFS